MYHSDKHFFRLLISLLSQDFLSPERSMEIPHILNSVVPSFSKVYFCGWTRVSLIPFILIPFISISF